MTKIKRAVSKKKITSKNIVDVWYLFHQIVSNMRRMNREGKVDDSTFAILHQEIDLILLKK